MERADHLEICKSKQWYETRADAIAYINNHPRYALWPYRCAFCKLYHLTSKPPSKELSDHTRAQEARYQAEARKERV